MLWKRYAKKAVLHLMACGINGVHTDLKKTEDKIERILSECFGRYIQGSERIYLFVQSNHPISKIEYKNP